MKDFSESLKDGFSHITDITDIQAVKKFREEGIRIDDEGYYSFAFGEHKEYELCIEPIGEDGQYQIALFKNRILLTEKLPVWTKKT